MNYYLDVDGVLLTKDHHPAVGAHEFIESLLSKGTVYWLTTHCRDGSTESVVKLLEQYFPADTISLLKQINPVSWNTLKTEAIDFDQDFLWFDDAPLAVELSILAEKQKLQNLITINLSDHPNYLETIQDSRM